jgi:hypothetical protein
MSELINKINNLAYTYPLPNHTELFSNLENKEIYIKNTWLSVPKNLLTLISGFIEHKKTHGSLIEKQFYQGMKVKDFIVRLLEKRALTFTGCADSYNLRNWRNSGQKQNNRGIGHWDKIGTDKETFPLLLKDYISYDEIEISAFLTLSCFTPFINNGSRHNCGRQDPDEIFQKEGIYMGQVGARFQVHKHMEWRYMIIDSAQNTIKNGYGPNNTSPKGLFLKLWADFYNVDHFPTYDEAMDNKLKYFVGNPNSSSHLNKEVYKQRVKANAIVFLEDANYRAKLANKKAYCHITGLGLGVWAINCKIQQTITKNAYIELFNDLKLEHISDVYFAWFSDIDQSEFPTRVNNIKIDFGRREPAEKLNNENLLLVANWAWDANSYVGNEYWEGFLGTSADPAAVCCSFVGYLGNPDLFKINNIHSW